MGATKKLLVVVLLALLFVGCAVLIQTQWPLFLAQSSPPQELQSVLMDVANIFPQNNDSLADPRSLHTRALYGSSVLKRHWTPRAHGNQVCIVISFYNGNEERRQAIRETWLKWTKGSCLKYRFVGDPGRLPSEPKHVAWHPERKQLLEEQKIFHDLFFVPGRVGWSTDMTRRTLAFMEYSEDHFDFDYFLMVDVDFFLCYFRLMRELQFAPRTKYAVGKVWCRGDTDSCFDEQFIIMSRDIIRHIVETKRTIGLDTQCATGQSIILWTSGTGVNYFHDPRIRSQPHNSPQGLQDRLYVCQKDIGLHHANVTHMYKIWKQETQHASNQIDIPIQTIAELRHHCPYAPAMTTDSCFKP
eukprot:TRINITY_DN9993_c0_g1_i1.p1 TRINITY_DN9993_c0_g1~~TRINITY_DN9993_c0_g1_i1.p1  ORF type:complete len:357 (-),score=55.16 TRINITY_DN9993_c0_g1_i1:294-1364(-)